MGFERRSMGVRVIVGIAGVVLCSGVAAGQSSEPVKPSEAKAPPPIESVGGIDVPADGEVVVSSKPKALGYITDPLFVGRLSEATLLGLLERSVRIMKQSPPTPKEVQITKEQGETIEVMFLDHRERRRKYNNETRLKVIALREAGGFKQKAPATLEEDKDFSPMLYINPQLIEPSGIGEDAVKVDRLTPEQHAAREELRALIAAGPVYDEIEIQVFAVLDEAQMKALQEMVQAEQDRMLKAQWARERTKRTGRMKIEDLPQATQDKLNAMEPRKRQAALDRIRMQRISGGALMLKNHRKKVQESIQRGIREREEKARQKQAAEEKKDGAGVDG